MAITTTSNYIYDSDAATWVALVTADGVTDNRAALQATIDHCNTNGGGTIFLPGGTIYCSHGTAYNTGWGATVMNSLSASLDLKSNIHICGTGTTVILTPSTAPGGSAARMSCLVKPGATNITLTGITFNGSAVAADSETDSFGLTVCGINTKDIDISDCEFRQYRGRVMYAVGQDKTFSAGSQDPTPTKWVSRVRCHTNRIKDSIGNGFGFFSGIDCENDLTFQNENLKVPSGGGAEPVISRGYHNLFISRQIIRNWGGGINLGGNSNSVTRNRNVLLTDWCWRTCSVESFPPPYSGINPTQREVDQFAVGTSSNTTCQRFLASAVVMDERGRYGSNAKFMVKFDGAESTMYCQANIVEDSTDYTSYSLSNLVVDAIDNTKVSSASFTFTSSQIGLVLDIDAGGGWTGGDYRIIGVSSGAALLSSSPAAVGTTGGSALFNNGGGIAVLGGDSSLWSGGVHHRGTFTSASSTTPGSAGANWGAVGTIDTTPSGCVAAFNSQDATLGKRGGCRVNFGNFGQRFGSFIPTTGVLNLGSVCGNCTILETGTDSDGVTATSGQVNDNLSFFFNSQVLNQSSASTRAINITDTNSEFIAIACNHYRNRSTGTNGYYTTGGTTYSVVTNNLYSRSGGTLTVTDGAGGTTANNASFSG